MSENVEFSPFAELVQLQKIAFGKVIDAVGGILTVINEAEILGFRKLMHRTQHKIKALIADYFFGYFEIMSSLPHFDTADKVKFTAVFLFHCGNSREGILEIPAEIEILISCFVGVMIL